MKEDTIEEMVSAFTCDSLRFHLKFSSHEKSLVGPRIRKQAQMLWGKVKFPSHAAGLLSSEARCSIVPFVLSRAPYAGSCAGTESLDASHRRVRHIWLEWGAFTQWCGKSCVNVLVKTNADEQSSRMVGKERRDDVTGVSLPQKQRGNVGRPYLWVLVEGGSCKSLEKERPSVSVKRS